MRLQPKTLLAVLLLILFAVTLGGGPALAGAAQQAQYAVPIMVVNTSFLNVRTGPGPEYAILTTVVGGTELPVLGVVSDREWYLVATASGNGWIDPDYVLARGDFRFVPEISYASVGAPVQVPYTPLSIGLPTSYLDQGGGGLPYPGTERYRAVVNVQTANLRALPEDESTVLTILFQDDKVDYAILGRTTDRRGIEWLQLDVPGVGAGWIETPKLRIRLSARSGIVLTVVGENVGVLERPRGAFLLIPPLQPGDEVFLLDIVNNGELLYVELPNGLVGYIPFAAAVSRENTTTDLIVQQPGYSAGPGVGQVPYIFDGQGGGGGQPGVFVPVQPGLPIPQRSLPLAIVNTGNLNIRSGPGAHFTSLAVVPGGTQLGVLAMASDEVWYLVQGPFGQGWINKDYVIFRGNFSGLQVIPYSVAAASAIIAAPIAVISAPVTLYAAPGTHYQEVGVVYGPAEAPVVARTADFTWVQLNTQYGYGWVPAAQIVFRGDAAVVPVV